MHELVTGRIWTLAMLLFLAAATSTVYAQSPTEATQLFVDSANAQAGTQGDPVLDVGLTPVFSAVFNHSVGSETTTDVKFQVATDPAFSNTVWSQGWKTIASTSAGARCPDVPYTGQNLSTFATYYWRVRFKDSQGNAGPWSTENASFRTIGYPTEATVLHVDTVDSQSGTQGNPVTGIGLQPVFSALFNHQDAAATTTEVKFQVATDPAFTNRVWSQGWKTIATTTAGQRSPDYPYGGQALAEATTYYWRIMFKDSFGDAGEWSTEAASFTTIEINDPPVLDAIADGFASEGRELSFVISASDPNTGQVLSYSADDGQGGALPTGAVFDSQTRTFSWRPGFDQAGIYSIRFTVEDDGSPMLSDTQTIAVVVEGAPSAPSELYVSNTDAQTGAQGDPVTAIGTTPLFSAVFYHSDVASTALFAEVEVSTDSTFATVTHWQSGQVSISATSVASRIPDIQYQGSALAEGPQYYWRIRLFDQFGLATDWSSKRASFALSAFPLEPTTLFVNSSSAQVGAQGNPVPDIDLSPVFTAVYDHPTAGLTGGSFRLQVSTDSTFVSVTHWDSGIQTMPEVFPGERTGNLAYAGAALQPNTTYFWRLRFWDEHFNPSDWSSEVASFTTIPSLQFDVPDTNFAHSRLTVLDLDQYTTGGTGGPYQYTLISAPSFVVLVDNTLEINPATGDQTGSPYTVSLEATDEELVGADSFQASVLDPIPAQPTGLVGTPLSNDSVLWSWTNPGPAGVGFRILGQDGTALADVPSSQTSYTETNLIENTTYTRKVIGIGAAGDEGTPSAEASATTLLPDPTSSTLVAQVESSSSIILYFSRPVNAVEGQTGVYFERDVDTSFSTADRFTLADYRQTYTYRDAVALPGSTYYYRFKYRNLEGQETASHVLGPIQTPAADAFLIATSERTLYALPSGMTSVPFDVAITDSVGTPLTGFGGTPVDFEITSGTQATLNLSSAATYSTTVNTSGAASGGTLSLNGETAVITVEATATLGGIPWKTSFRVIPTNGPVSLEILQPVNVTNRIEGDIGTSVPGATIRALDAEGNPLANTTLMFTLTDADGGGEAFFDVLGDPKTETADTDMNGEYTTSDIKLTGTYTFTERLRVNAIDSTIGSLSVEMPVSGVGYTSYLGPPSALVVRVEKANQERAPTEEYAPVEVYVEDQNGFPVPGALVRMRSADVDANAATNPPGAVAYYLDDPLSPTGPSSTSPPGTLHMPTHQYGVFGDLDIQGSIEERHGHQMIGLPDGRILVVGGRKSSGSVGPDADAFTIDPANNCEIAIQTQISKREDHALALLPSGEVLIVGGVDEFGSPAATELFDPMSDSVTAVGGFPLRRKASVQALANGNVVVVGGFTGSPSSPTNQNSFVLIQDVGGAYQPDPAVPFPPSITARYESGLALDAANNWLYVVGSTHNSVSQDEILVFDANAGGSVLPSIFISWLPFTTVRPRAVTLVSGGSFLVAGPDGAALLDANGVAQQAISQTVGELPAIVNLPVDPDPMTGGNDLSGDRFVIVGGTSTVLARFGPPLNLEGFFPGPVFDDSDRQGTSDWRATALQSGNPHGVAMIVGGGTSTTFESFTEPRAYKHEEGLDEPREPAFVTDSSGKVEFAKIRAGVFLGRQTLRFTAEYPDPLGGPPVVGYTYAHLYAVEDSACGAPGAYPSDGTGQVPLPDPDTSAPEPSGGGMSPPDVEMLGEVQPNILRWIKIKDNPEACCVGDCYCVFKVRMLHDFDLSQIGGSFPMYIYPMSGPGPSHVPNVEWSVSFQILGPADTARIVKVQQAQYDVTHTDFTITVEVLQESAVVNDLNLLLVGRANDEPPQSGNIRTANWSKLFTGVRLKLEMCEDQPGGRIQFVGAEGHLKAILYGPSGIAFNCFLDAGMGTNVSVDPKNFRLVAGQPRDVLVSVGSPSAMKDDLKITGYLYLPQKCHCDKIEFTAFKLRAWVCEENTDADDILFVRPDFGRRDWQYKWESLPTPLPDFSSDPAFYKKNGHAQFTPAFVELQGPADCALTLTIDFIHEKKRTSDMGTGIRLIDDPSGTIFGGETKQFYLDGGVPSADVSAQVGDFEMKVCAGPMAEEEGPSAAAAVVAAPSPTGSDYYGPIVEVTLTPGGPAQSGTGNEFDENDHTTSSGDDEPHNPVQDAPVLTIPPCNHCIFLPLTKVQIITSICDLCDEQSDDFACKPDALPTNAPFTYMFMKALGPKGLALTLNVRSSDFSKLRPEVPQVTLTAQPISKTTSASAPSGCRNPIFHGFITEPGTEVVRLFATDPADPQASPNPSGAPDDINVGLFFPCAADTERENPEFLDRIDLQSVSAELMVNLETLTVIQIKVLPCDTEDLRDDLTLFEGTAPVVIEMTPDFSASSQFQGLKLPLEVRATTDPILIRPQGDTSPGYAAFGIELQGSEVIEVLGIEKSTLPRDGIIEVTHHCDDTISKPNAGTSATQLPHSPPCGEGAVTVFWIEADLPEFNCVNETDQASFTVRAPQGTDFPLTPIDFTVSANGPYAGIYNLNPDNHSFTAWDEVLSSTLTTGTMPSAHVGDINILYDLAIDTCDLTGEPEDKRTVYTVEVDTDPICLPIKENFHHPATVSTRISVVPGIPEGFSWVRVYDDGAPTVSDPTIPVIGLKQGEFLAYDALVNARINMPTTAGFGQQNIAAQVLVNGQYHTCGDATDTLIVGGIPAGVPAEGNEFLTEFTLVAGLPYELPLREIPLGVGQFNASKTSGAFSLVVQPESVQVLNYSTATGPYKFQTSLTVAKGAKSRTCRVDYTIDFRRNQGPNFNNCSKPKPVGPLLQAPETAGSPEGDTQDCGDPVQLDRGDVSLSRSDLVIPGRGFDFAHVRTYRGMSEVDTAQGLKWDFAYNIHLEPQQDGSVLLVEGDKSRAESFDYVDGIRFGTPNEYFCNLTFINQQYRLIQPDGKLYLFDSSGRFIEIRDPNGNSMQFEHTDSMHPDRLTAVVDTMGRPISYAYYPDNDPNGRAGRLQSITDFAQRQVYYDYDSTGHLTTVRSPVVTGTSNGNDFPNGKTESYSYHTGTGNTAVEDKLQQVVRANENESRTGFGSSYGVSLGTPTIEFQYYADGRVQSQSWGGSTITYEYRATFLAGGDDRNPVTNYTKVTDRSGNVTEYYFSSRGQIVERRELTRGLRAGEPAAYVTKWRYNDLNQLVRITMPEGDTVEYTYDDGIVQVGSATIVEPRLRSNVNEVRRLPGPRAADQTELVTQFVVEPIYNKQCVVVDPRGYDTGSNLKYASRSYFDYEEGDNTSRLSQYMVPYLDSTPSTGAGWQYVNALLQRMQARGSALGIGATSNVPAVGIVVGSDLNGDGETTSVAGNVVRTLMPKVTLTAEQAAILATGTEQYVSSATFYNQFGQRTGTVDATGNISVMVYNSTANPSGGGATGGEVTRDDGSISGGYLAEIHGDVSASSAASLIVVGKRAGGSGPLQDSSIGAFTSPISRDSSEPAEVQTQVSLTYDVVGNATSTTDERGATTVLEYNALDQVVSVQAPTPYGYASSFFYDANNNVVQTTTENSVIQVDGNGRLQLTPSGQFLNTVLTTGTTTEFVNQFQFDLLDNLRTSDIDAVKPDGTPVTLTTTYSYDANQNLQLVTQPEGNQARAVFDERDLLFTSTRGFGSVGASMVQMDYDGNRNLIALHDGTGDVTTSVFDGFDRVKQVIDAEGNDLGLTYDAAGNALSNVLRGPVNGQSSTHVDLIRTYTTFDELSRPFETKQDIFDENQQPVATGGPTASQSFVRTLTAFDANSRPRGVIEDDGALNATTNATTAFRYDGLHRVVEVIDALGNTNSYEYDAASNLTKSIALHLATDGSTAAETYTTSYAYDVLNRLTRATDNLSNVTQYGYDSRGNLTHTTDALQNTSVSVFDGASRLRETIRDMRATAPQIADDKINTRYDYDQNSRMTSVEDDNGNVTSYAYDALDRLTSTTYANSGVVSFTYDEDDNVLTSTDQNGTLVTSAYDALNRLLSRTVTLPGPVTTRASSTTSIVGTTLQTFEYDGANRTTRATDNNDAGDPNDDAECTYIYDSLSRVTSETQAYNSQSYTVGYSYVSDNRLDQLSYPGGNQVDFTYDDLDRVHGMDWNTQSVHTEPHDSHCNFIGPSRSLNCTVLGKVVRDFYDPSDSSKSGYDGLGRPVYLSYGAGTLTLGYDAVGNEGFEYDTQTLGAGNDARNFESYLYDAAYRLSDFKTGVAASAPSIPSTTTQTGDTRLNGQNATNPGFNMGPFARDLSWALDGVGNWKGFTEDGTNHTNTVGSINQYTDFKGVSLDNAPNGNMVLDLPWGGMGTGSSGTDQIEYEFDAFNRLHRVFFFDTGTSMDVTVGEYDYDAMGRRIFRSADEDHDGTLETAVRYVYSGKQVIEERDGAGALQREYVYGSYVDEPIWMRDTTSTLATDEFIFGQDENFNTYALFNLNLDQLTFSVAEQYRYDAYGEFTVYDAGGNITGTSAGGATPLSPHTFQGRRWDVEAGLYYYRARHLNPRQGRFLSFDPLGYRDGMGLYTFTSSSPLASLDPTGMGVMGLVGATLSFGNPLTVGSAWESMQREAEDMKAGAREHGYFGSLLGKSGWDKAKGTLERSGSGQSDFEIIVTGIAIGGWEMTGIPNLIAAIEGKDPWSGCEISTEERWIRGITGSIQLGLMLAGPTISTAMAGGPSSYGASTSFAGPGSRAGAPGSTRFKGPNFKVSGSKYPNHARMLRNAKEKGHPFKGLNKGAGKNEARRNRYYAQKEIRKQQGPPEKNMNYDEYPYASTKQGGAGAHVEPVDAAENQAVGRELGKFYRENGLSEGDPFGIVIIP